ncbi:MAG: YueI family protein [Bacillota bacterium]
METYTQSEPGQKGPSELEKVLAYGLRGEPELKHAEKTCYLGEFRERVLLRLTNKQVAEPGLYPEVAGALQNHPSSRMIINGGLSDKFEKKYQQLCRQLGKKYTIVHDPECKGDTGLLVVSDQAVDADGIDVEDRHARLKSLGLPEELILAAGQKVCSRCLARVKKSAPAETINYEELTPGDRLWGAGCPACK